MKRILFICLALLISIFVHCQKITINQAKTVAENTITERIKPLKSNVNYKITEVITETYNNNNVFYIFNLSPNGFIIISAHESTEPLLAFSYESKYDNNDINPATSSWLKSYSKQIEYSIANNLVPTQSIKNKWNHFLKAKSEFKSKEEITSVEPLISTKWNQGTYYNFHCPKDPNGTSGHAVTGCVATALGQLMNYFRYPERGAGAYGYEHPDYGWLEVDFSQQTYDYSKMPTRATDENDEIAKLLYNIGVSVDMKYGPNSSGMNNHKGAYTLHTYFDYSPETKYLFKDSLPEDFDWNGTLVDHLNRKIPLYYAGWGDYEYVSGHAFILDGYSDSTHYHINWGWGGNSDGYFLINNLRPGGSDFTLLHEVIVNAVPNNLTNNCNELKVINHHEGAIDDGSGPLQNYQQGLDCSWLILPGDSIESINIEFQKFDIANSDYVVIYDGETESSPILATFYGSDTPSKLSSTSDKVLIKFITNSDEEHDGWLLSYSCSFYEFCNSTVTLDAASGIITDGSGNFQYKNNSNCWWFIKHDGMKNVKITFDEFDIEPNDFVNIINKNGATIYEFNNSNVIESSIIESEIVVINFISDYEKRGNGFTLHYETNVENDIEILESIDYISLYPNPTKDKIFLNLENVSEKVSIQIFSNDGKLCEEKTFYTAGNSEIGIDISKYPSGIYYISIANKGITKLIKE